MSPLARALSASPELFPAALDLRSGTVSLWRLSREDYQRHSFLDGRIAAQQAKRQLPFAELATAVEETALPESCNFIFHIGHAGSTLVSRLLGKNRAFFSVREPDILRTLALAPQTVREPHLPVFLKLWSRTFQPALAVVKTTSFVSEIAVDILSRPYKPRALAMGVAPEIYLAAIFGGANAPAEARALAPMRLARLNRHLSTQWSLDQFSQGEIVALGWACESLCLGEAAASAADRVLAIDFERFLRAPHQYLGRMFEHLGARTPDSEIATILSGNEMRSYSKAPEHAYDTATRNAVLADGRERHANEIRAGLAWLERTGAGHSQIATALSLFP